MKKKIVALILAVITLTALSIPVFAVSIPRPNENRCVYDGAKVLTTATADHIEKVNLSLEQSGLGAEIGVVTLEQLPLGYDSEEYSYEIFNSWGIGDKKADNGILLLLVPSQGKCWAMVGDGLNNYLTSYDLEEILNKHFYDDFDDGYYDRAVKNTVDQFVAELEFIYDTEVYDVSNVAYSNRRYESSNYFNSDLLVGIGIVVVVIVLALIFTPRGRSTRRYAPPRPYYNNRPYRGGPNIYIGRPHHHHHHNNNHRGGGGFGGLGGGGFGGGGFGGGSFGGFGGGSSGGGGAGRK